MIRILTTRKSPIPNICKKQFKFNSRLFSSSNSDGKTKGELLLTEKLTKKFQPKYINVTDISGGCGSMYQIDIESNHFKNLNLVKQHKLVNEELKEEIKLMHGIRINSKAVDN